MGSRPFRYLQQHVLRDLARLDDRQNAMVAELWPALRAVLAAEIKVIGFALGRNPQVQAGDDGIVQHIAGFGVGDCGSREGE